MGVARREEGTIMKRKRAALVVALGVSVGAIGLASPTASARTDNPNACFGQNTSFFVSQGVSLKEEAAANGFPNVGAMLQFFRAELPFGCIGEG
jgi:hypothetical protein